MTLSATKVTELLGREEIEEEEEREKGREEVGARDDGVWAADELGVSKRRGDAMLAELREYAGVRDVLS